MSKVPRHLKTSDAETVPLNGRIAELPSKPPRRVALDAATLNARRKLQWACICSLIFMLAEVVGGFLAGSLAIMTDAAHLLSDVGGFCISLAAIWMQTLPPSSRLSFGFQRAEVIGAISSVLVIWVLTGVLVYAAIERFMECLQPHPVQHVNGKLMFIVACIGLLVNVILMQILGHDHSHSHGGSHSHAHGHSHSHDHSHDHNQHASPNHNHPHPQAGHGCSHDDLEVGIVPVHAGADCRHDHDHARDHDEHAKKDKKHSKKKGLENLNVEAAYIHALGDFLQSVGVCVAGALIWYKPEWQIADPIATFLFSAVVLATTIGIMKSSVHVLMEGTPEGIQADEIQEGLSACASVVAVHDLHIWSLRAGMPSLSVHLVSDDTDAALHEAQNYLMAMGIVHTTIQVEHPTRQYPRDCNNLTCGQNSPEHK